MSFVIQNDEKFQEVYSWLVEHNSCVESAEGNMQVSPFDKMFESEQATGDSASESNLDFRKADPALFERKLRIDADGFNYYEPADTVDIPALTPDATPLDYAIETLAWYKPITFSGKDCGIYIKTKGIIITAQKVKYWLTKYGYTSPKSNIDQDSYFIAIRILLSHEILHHRVESFAIRLHMLTGKANYENYFNSTYLPLMKLASDDLIEEALASHNELNFGNAIETLGTWKLSEQKSAVRRGLLETFKDRPAGYRMAAKLKTKTDVEQAIHKLSIGISPASQFPKASFPLDSNLFEVNRKGLFESALLRNVIYVAETSHETFPLGLSIPTKDLETLLKRNGFELVKNQGKGSHSKWKKPGQGPITVPHRKDQQGFSVLESVVKALGLKNLNELRNEIQNL